MSTSLVAFDVRLFRNNAQVKVCFALPCFASTRIQRPILQLKPEAGFDQFPITGKASEAPRGHEACGATRRNEETGKATPLAGSRLGGERA
jgi:hypothetical protein